MVTVREVVDERGTVEENIPEYVLHHGKRESVLRLIPMKNVRMGII